MDRMSTATKILPLVAAHGDDLVLRRELVRVCGAFRYARRATAEVALAGLRDRIARGAATGHIPLELACTLLGSTLHVEITVPMFEDHEDIAAWCGHLSRTAAATSFTVQVRTL